VACEGEIWLVKTTWIVFRSDVLPKVGIEALSQIEELRFAKIELS
jgi:hypothetical protein